MKATKILLTTMVLTSIATSAFASNPVNIVSGDGIKVEDISENYSEFNHLTSIPTMSHLDKRGETKIDGSVIELHNTAVNGEAEQLTAIDGKHISFNRSGDYKTSVDVDGIYTLHYDQGMSAYAGGIDVWGHENNDDTTELREMSFSVSKVDVGGQQIHGVSNGKADTDAVNIAQLKKAEEKINDVEREAKKHTTVVAGDNTTVTTSTNTNGGTEYKVAVNKDVNLTQEGSLRTGRTTVTNYGLKVKSDDDYYTVVTTGEVTVREPDGSGTLTNGNVILYNYTDGSASKLNTTGVIAQGPDRSVLFTTEGIYAGDQIINAVKAGVEDTDAVNVAQLKRLQDQITASTSVTTVTAGDHIKVTPTVNGNTHDYKVSLADDIANQINNNTTNITNNTTNINKNAADIKNIKGDLSKMDKRIDKSVAGAAALAALHPLDFDPDAKWDFAAGYGHYRSGDAAAIGAFYRPNEDVQLSIGSTVGSDETVFNAGLSVKVGAHSGVSRSRVAIGKEVLALKKTVAEQNAQIQKLTALLNGVAGTKMKADHTTLFPDVAANHWAYEAVSDLSRRGLVEGYPDGTFGGDRLLTRYEFAQIVYRAIQDGVTVDDRLVTEFSPEMALFRVDTVAKNAQGEPTIERVRVNKK